MTYQKDVKIDAIPRQHGQAASWAEDEYRKTMNAEVQDKTNGTDLSDRMKAYEGRYRSFLELASDDDAVVIRVDGKAFHTYTRGCQKPFDLNLHAAMDRIAEHMCSQIPGSVLGYVQSDEVSVVIRPMRNDGSEPWLGGNVQKMCSIASAMASVRMTTLSHTIFGETRPALFDARVFVLPRREISNYLIWRQSDATRNSVQMLARSVFSHRQLVGKSCDEMRRMLLEKGNDWDALDGGKKRGRVILKKAQASTVSYVDKRTKDTHVADVVRTVWAVDTTCPSFLEDRSYFEKKFDAAGKDGA